MKKLLKKTNVFYLSAIILGIVNAVCNVISMFKGNDKSYLFNLGIGEVSVNICSTAFIILAAIILIMYIITNKKDYIALSTLLYIAILLLQIPVFKFKLVLIITLGMLVLLGIGAKKEKNVKKK